MMMHVILSAPRPSLEARFAGQLFSIIISTTVANPLNLLLSIGASSFEFAFVPNFFGRVPEALAPETLLFEFYIDFVDFKSVGLFYSAVYSCSFAFALTTKSHAY